MTAEGSRVSDLLFGRRIDDAPDLLEQCYRLRYQVYCVERRFLPAEQYPDQLERDEFDRFSVHLGVVDREGALVATSRLVEVSVAGLPLFRHCQIFPHETEIYLPAHRIVEVSRLSVSRRLRTHRRHRTAVVGCLYRALYQASKRQGFTHWLVATERSLQRLVTRYGFPFRAVGPPSDYFGQVVPYVMDLREFDAVILSRTRPTLDSFLDGLEPEVNPLSCIQVA